RVRQLAVQSVNATNSARDRQALQNEVGQLAAELNRIARSTEFNGQKIFDGTFSTQLFQVGHQANDYIVATTANFKTGNYGDYRIYGIGSVIRGNTNYDVVANNSIIVSGSEGSQTILWATTETAAQVAEKVNLFKDDTGVSAWAITEMDVYFSPAASGPYRFDLWGDNKITPVAIGFTVDAGTGVEALSRAATAFNDVQSKTGVVATVKSDGSGIRLSHYYGEHIVLQDTSFANAGTVVIEGTNQVTSSITFLPDALATTAWATGQVIFDSDRSFTVQGTGVRLVSNPNEASVLQKVADLDISTVEGAKLAIAVADTALMQLTSQRAKFGALQARFESTIRNLQTTIENLSAARSRTRDADFAIETAELTRTQILQQAGTAVLAQANTIPQNVLTLLQ
ncbi:MAG: flagellin, partial [Gammaproteobacteria bacterium]|nr:flagellin [Gammaproteobacteria bacterium]